MFEEQDLDDWEALDYSGYNDAATPPSALSPPQNFDDWESLDYSGYNQNTQPPETEAVSALESPNPEDEYTLGERAGDLGASFGIGSGALVGGAGWIADVLGMDNAADAMYKFSENTVNHYTKKLSPEAQAELQKEFVTVKEGGKWYNPTDWERPEDAAGMWAAALIGMQSAPSTAVGMGLGGKIGQGLYAIAQKTKTLGALEKVAEVGRHRAALGLGASDKYVAAGANAEKVLNRYGKAAGAVGGGIGEALPAAGMAGHGVKTEVMEKPHEFLWDRSPHYRDIFRATEDLNLSFEERYLMAKEQLADLASSKAGIQAGISAFLLGAPAGAVTASLWNKALPTPFATGKIAGAAKGTATEMVQEFFQSGAEAFTSNMALREYMDETLDVSRGVINAAVGGAVSGAMMGSVFGAAGTPTKGQAANDELAKKSQDDMYKLKAFGALSHAALTTEFKMDSATAMTLIDPIIQKYTEDQNIVGAVTDLRHLEKYGRLRERGVDDVNVAGQENLDAAKAGYNTGAGETPGPLPIPTDGATSAPLEVAGATLIPDGEARNGVDYFMIDRTVGADGGRIDAMRAQGSTGTGIHVIEQVKADGTPDEHKVVFGAADDEDAKATYQRFYRGFDDEQDRNIGSVTSMNDTEFADWMNATSEESSLNRPTREILEEQENERQEAEAGLPETQAPDAAAPENDVLEEARAGDTAAQERLTSFGLTWDGDKTKYRLMGKDEAAKVLAGETVTSDRFGENAEAGVTDITDNPDYASVSADSDHRITFKQTPRFDSDKVGSTTREKNKAKGEYHLTGGYSLSDVQAIEQRQADGTWKVIHGTLTDKSAPRETSETRVEQAKTKAKKSRMQKAADKVSAQFKEAHEASQSRGHDAVQGGLQGHSVGDTYPYMVVGIGDKWAIQTPDGKFGTKRYDSSGEAQDRARELRNTEGPDEITSYSLKRLTGKPEEFDEDGKSITLGYFSKARKAAKRYAKSRGEKYTPPENYVPIDEKRGKRLAKEFAAMEHNPSDPLVKAAYQAMIEETSAQYDEILKTGLKVEFNQEGNDPYGVPKNAILDVIKNNHLFVFPTNEGFGSDADVDVSDNPLLAPTKYTDINGKPMVANDVFRVVHDYFGHIQNGVGFRARGEENAWQSHAAMYSRLARRAMTVETRGQNSVVNFGPNGEFNRTASQADTIYADQKIGLLPVWASEEARDSEQNRRHDSVYTAGLQGAIRDGRVQLSHFSTVPGLTRTDPAKAGTGIDRFARRHKPEGTWFGITQADENGYRRETFFQGVPEYVGSLEPTALYPVDADPENLWVDGSGTNSEKLDQSIENMKAAGFSGYWSDHESLGKVAFVWDHVQVELDTAPAREAERRQAASERMTAYNKEQATRRQYVEKLFGRDNWARIEAEVDAATAGAVTTEELQEAAIEWMMRGVESKYFKRWFGESPALRDQWNQPMRFYRGVAKDSESFIPRHKHGGGFVSLATNPDFASQFAESSGAVRGGAPVVYAVYARAEKVFDFRNAKMRRSFKRWWNETYKNTRATPANKNLLKELKTGQWDALESIPVRLFMKERGYDAFWMMESGELNLGVFDSKNIKSATGNIGTFHHSTALLSYSLSSQSTGQQELVGRPVGNTENLANEIKDQLADMLLRSDQNNIQPQDVDAIVNDLFSIGPEAVTGLLNPAQTYFATRLVEHVKLEQWKEANAAMEKTDTPEYGREFVVAVASAPEQEGLVSGVWEASNVIVHYQARTVFDTDTGQSTLVIDDRRDKPQGYRYGTAKSEGREHVVRYASENNYTQIKWPDGSVENVTPHDGPLNSLTMSPAAEIGRRLELYQLQSHILRSTTSSTTARAMKARLIDGVVKGLYSQQILQHSGALNHLGDRAKLLIQVSSRVSGPVINERYSIPASVIRQEIKRVTSDWENSPQYFVHDTYRQLPEHLRNNVEQLGYEDRVEGTIDPQDGSIHIVAENIHTVDQLFRVYMEEALGHHGLRETFGEELDVFLDSVLPEVKGSPAWEDLHSEYPHLRPQSLEAKLEEMANSGLSREQIEIIHGRTERSKERRSVDELLAKMDVKQSVWEKFVGWVRQWLRKHGMITNWTDNDLRQIMAHVHRNIIGGRAPHAWGKRNHAPVWNDGILNYSLYGGKDAMLLSKLEKALKNKKAFRDNNDTAKPRVWLKGIKGTEDPAGWRGKTPASRKISERVGFSETELELTGIIDFLIERHEQAPNVALTEKEVLDVFEKTKPKVMVVSRAGYYLFPSLPLADLLVYGPPAINNNFNRDLAEQETGYFSARIDEILEEENHTTLRKVLNLQTSELTPLLLTEQMAISPFGYRGVPSIHDLKDRGHSNEDISSILGVENAFVPISKTNMSAVLRGRISQFIVDWMENSDDSVFRNIEIKIPINLHGYPGGAGIRGRIKFDVDQNGDVINIDAHGDDDPEFLPHMMKEIESLQAGAAIGQIVNWVNEVGHVYKEYYRRRAEKVLGRRAYHETETPEIQSLLRNLSGPVFAQDVRGSVSSTGRSEIGSVGSTRSDTLYGGYTLDGGSDLDVLSVQLYAGPTNQGAGGSGTYHFDPGMSGGGSNMWQDVVHIRAKTRHVDVNGVIKKLFAIEEVQSDWASNYRKANANPAAYHEWLKQHGKTMYYTMQWLHDNYGWEAHPDFGLMSTITGNLGEAQVEEWANPTSQNAAANRVAKIVGTSVLSNTVNAMLLNNPELKTARDAAKAAFKELEPDWNNMPWTSSYPELAVNIAVAYARDNGFDGVAWYDSGDDAAFLYGGYIAQQHAGMKISLKDLSVRGWDTSGDFDPAQVEFPAIHRGSYLQPAHGGENYTDYLQEIIAEGGPNAAVATDAAKFLDAWIDNNGTQGTSIENPPNPLLKYHPDSETLLVRLPVRRLWNAKIHKLLYNSMIPSAAKAISKNSLGQVFIEDSYNEKRRGWRPADQDFTVDESNDRVEGPIDKDSGAALMAQWFGRNGHNMRQALVGLYAGQSSNDAYDRYHNSLFDAYHNLPTRTNVEATIEGLTVVKAKDNDDRDPWVVLVQFTYTNSKGELKHFDMPMTDGGVNIGFGDISHADGGDADYTTPFMYRMFYQIMKDMWGMENPTPIKLSPYVMERLYSDMVNSVMTQADTGGLRNMLDDAVQSHRDNDSNTWEPDDWKIPWNVSTSGEVVNFEMNIDEGQGPQLEALTKATAADSAYDYAAIRSILLEVDGIDSDDVARVTMEFDRYGSSRNLVGIPRAYVNGLPETGSTLVKPAASLENPEYGEQVWKVLWTDDTVKGKELFMPFSLKSDPNKKERAIINKKIARSNSRMTVLDRVSHWVSQLSDWGKTGDLKWAIKQGMLDSTASVERLEREIFGQVLDASVSPHKMMHMTKNLPSVMAAIAKAGIPELQGGVFQPVRGRKGFIEILRPLYEHPDGDLLDLWEGYAAARRANDLIKQVNPDGTSREKLFTQQEIDDLLALGNQYPVFKDVFDEWSKFNNDLLSLATKHGILNQRERDAWAQNAYVPFYRAMEEIEGVDQRSGYGRVKAGVEGQRSGIKRLTGGTQMLGSIVENMWFNTASLIDKVYKNEAMRRVVEMAEGTVMTEVSLPWEAVKISNNQLASALKKAGILSGDALKQVKAMTTDQRLAWSTVFRRVRPTGDNIVSVMREGKPVYYEVSDELLLNTLQAMGPDGLSGVMQLMGFSKSLLTRMITIEPGFMLANWLRDTLSAWVTSDANFVPVLDSIKAMGDVWQEDGTFTKMMMAGAGGGGFYDLSGGNVTQALDDEFGRGNMRWLHNAWRGYMKIGAMSENSNRLAIANRILKNGGTTAEAMHSAQDIMNFTMSGDYDSVRFLIRTVPFLNARMQGLYRLFRGARDNPVGFAIKGSVLMAASLALLAKNWDDDDYEELDEWAKDTNWNFFVGGMRFTIPKPFEVGLLFATVPERLMRALLGRDDLQVSTDAMKRALLDTLAFNPIPQLFKPMVELYSNTNMFTQTPIENASIRRFEDKYRAYPWTSPIASRIGGMMPDGSGALQSPARIEHTIRAYTGTVGLYTLNSLDWLLRQVDDSLPEPPAKNWWERPVANRVIKGETRTSRSNKYEEQVYKVLEQSQEAQNTYNMLAKQERLEEAQELAKKRRHLINPDINPETGRATKPDEVTPRTELGDVQKALREISAQSRAISVSTKLDAKTKRKMMDDLTIQKNEILNTAAGLLEQLDEIKNTPEEEVPLPQ